MHSTLGEARLPLAILLPSFLQDQDEAPLGGDQLTSAEEAAVRQFLEVVNPWRSSRGYQPLQWNAAVKFLMAR